LPKCKADAAAAALQINSSTEFFNRIGWKQSFMQLIDQEPF